MSVEFGNITARLVEKGKAEHQRHKRLYDILEAFSFGVVGALVFSPLVEKIAKAIVNLVWRVPHG